MIDVTTARDEHGHPVVIARCTHAEGRIHLLTDGTMALTGAFGNPMTTGNLDLLLAALEETRRHAPGLVLTDDTVFTARIVTDDSVEPDDGPEQLADIVITADGCAGPPVATYTVYTNPLDPIGEDPADVLARHGWRMADDGELDADDYLIVRVERA